MCYFCIFCSSATSGTQLFILGLFISGSYISVSSLVGSVNVYDQSVGLNTKTDSFPPANVIFDLFDSFNLLGASLLARSSFLCRIDLNSSGLKRLILSLTHFASLPILSDSFDESFLFTSKICFLYVSYNVLSTRSDLLIFV